MALVVTRGRIIGVEYLLAEPCKVCIDVFVITPMTATKLEMIGTFLDASVKILALVPLSAYIEKP